MIRTSPGGSICSGLTGLGQDTAAQLEQFVTMHASLHRSTSKSSSTHSNGGSDGGRLQQGSNPEDPEGSQISHRPSRGHSLHLPQPIFTASTTELLSTSARRSMGTEDAEHQPREYHELTQPRMEPRALAEDAYTPFGQRLVRSKQPREQRQDGVTAVSTHISGDGWEAGVMTMTRPRVCFRQ